MMLPEKGEFYLVKLYDATLINDIRIAQFLGVDNLGDCGCKEWAGDSGHSSDGWYHSDVEWYIPLDKIRVISWDKYRGALEIELIN